jgi:MEMO1 family protein
MDRKPAVAGTFYPASRERLESLVAECFAAGEPGSEKKRFIGAVVPHAGLVYSGHVAAALYGTAEIPERLVVLSPNHTGAGRPAAIQSEGSWLTPLGALPVDADLAGEIAASSSLVEEDRLAHLREHSLEVQLPFLQYLGRPQKFVPLCLSLPSYAACESLGEALADVLRRHEEEGEHVAIVASSDMNHYESHEVTLKKDQRAIDAILALDPEELWKRVRAEDISMCGIIPATVMLVAARRLGASHATLVRHATSGEVSGDYGAVVGYASVLVS